MSDEVNRQVFDEAVQELIRKKLTRYMEENRIGAKRNCLGAWVSLSLSVIIAVWSLQTRTPSQINDFRSSDRSTTRQNLLSPFIARLS